MSVHTWKFICIVAGMALGMPAYGQRPERRPGQPIEFSKPLADTASSNLNDIVTQKGMFQSLPPESQKTLDIFSAGDSGESLIMPPIRQLPPPQVNSKHLKELLEKRKDRGFETPEDLVTGLTAEEIFKVPELDRDGQEKKKLSKMERYYQQLERPHQSSTNQTKGDDLFGRQTKSDGREDFFFGAEQKLGASANISAPTLKPLFGSDSPGGFSTEMNKSWNSSESSGFANVEPHATTRARATRLQDFKDLLSPPVASGPAGNSFSPPVATHGLMPSLGADSLSGATARGPLPAASVGAPLALPTSVASRPSLAPAPPRRLPLPSQSFDVPKRKF